MPASFKMTHLAEIAARLRPRKLAVLGMMSLAAMLLLLGPLVLTPAAFKMFAASTAENARAAHSQVQPGVLVQPGVQVQPGVASPWRDPHWAGGLESLRSKARSASASDEPLTSASYTSGFDEKAAGLAPLPPETPLLRFAQAHDPRACPDDLNCSFRTPKGAGLSPPRRPVATPTVFKHVQTDSPSQPSGLTLPLLPVRLSWPSPHLSLPTANSWLQPFAFVSNTVVGFVKKL